MREQCKQSQPNGFGLLKHEIPISFLPVKLRNKMVSLLYHCGHSDKACKLPLVLCRLSFDTLQQTWVVQQADMKVVCCSDNTYDHSKAAACWHDSAIQTVSLCTL